MRRLFTDTTHIVSEIGAVVKVVDSHPCGLGSIPGKCCSFFIVSILDFKIEA